MNSMGHNSRMAENKLPSRPPASSPTGRTAQTPARQANPSISERPTTTAASLPAAKEPGSQASASSSADSSGAGSAANPTVPALALLMPMTFQGASFVTSEGGQADNEATDSKTAPSSSENSDDDDATTASACWALSDPAGWLAAKLSASSAAPGQSLGATNAVAGRTDGVGGVEVAANSTDPASAKDSPAAELPSPLSTATSQADASATTSLATSLMPAAADAPPGQDRQKPPPFRPTHRQKNPLLPRLIRPTPSRRPRNCLAWPRPPQSHHRRPLPRLPPIQRP